MQHGRASAGLLLGPPDLHQTPRDDVILVARIVLTHNLAPVGKVSVAENGASSAIFASSGFSRIGTL
jgi:hypothetical protein